MLSPPAEVLLSYFTGLAPVGQMVEPSFATLKLDLGYTSKVPLYRLLNELIGAGCVKRLSAGSNGSTGLLVVTRRLEAMPERHLPPAPPQPLEPVFHPRASRIDWAARLAEIPPDTRSLTARICGDPIPNDQRRRSLNA